MDYAFSASFVLKLVQKPYPIHQNNDQITQRHKNFYSTILDNTLKNIEINFCHQIFIIQTIANYPKIRILYYKFENLLSIIFL